MVSLNHFIKKLKIKDQLCVSYVQMDIYLECLLTSNGKMMTNSGKEMVLALFLVLMRMIDYNFIDLMELLKLVIGAIEYSVWWGLIFNKTRWLEQPWMRDGYVIKNKTEIHYYVARNMPILEKQKFTKSKVGKDKFLKEILLFDYMN